MAFAACAAAFSLCLPSASAQQQVAPQQPVPAVSDELVITLLGTGTPSAIPERFGFSNLVQAGGLNLLFDAGRGATIRINQMGMPVGEIDAVFLTHFHSDHVNGLADVFMTGYLVGGIGGRKVPLELYGPKGTARLAEGIRLAHLSDIETRMLDEGVPEPATYFKPIEMDEGVVFERNGVKVTMFRVLHGEKIDPSVGYRIDYKNRSVIFSGDTKYDENVIKLGTGADLLVHSVGTAPQDMLQVPFVKRVLAHHTSPEEAGRVFSQAEPGLAVFSHLVRLEGKNGPVPLSELVERTRTTYSGPLLVGEDLMQLRIGEKGVSIFYAGM